MAQKQTPGGTILQSQDGTWYYIRDDQLSQFRVADKETLDAFRRLEEKENSDVAGFAGGFALVKGGPVTIFNPSVKVGLYRVNRTTPGIGVGVGTC